MCAMQCAVWFLLRYFDGRCKWWEAWTSRWLSGPTYALPVLLISAIHHLRHLVLAFILRLQVICLERWAMMSTKRHFGPSKSRKGQCSAWKTITPSIMASPYAAAEHTFGVVVCCWCFRAGVFWWSFSGGALILVFSAGGVWVFWWCLSCRMFRVVWWWFGWYVRLAEFRWCFGRSCFGCAGVLFIIHYIVELLLPSISLSLCL